MSPLRRAGRRAGPSAREAVLACARDFDPQPFHLDVAAAAASPFDRLSASGWHTCALAMRMMCAGRRLGSSSLGSPDVGVLVCSRWEVPNQHGEVVPTTERCSMCRRRPADASPPPDAQRT